MMFSPLPREEVSKFHFVPQAVVNQPPDFFAAKGAEFHEEQDDLDDFIVSELLLDGEVPFALMRYRGNPPGQTTLFLSSHSSLSQIQGAVQSILSGFGLGMSSLAWIRQSMDTPY